MNQRPKNVCLCRLYYSLHAQYNASSNFPNSYPSFRPQLISSSGFPWPPSTHRSGNPDMLSEHPILYFEHLIPTISFLFNLMLPNKTKFHWKQQLSLSSTNLWNQAQQSIQNLFSYLLNNFWPRPVPLIICSIKLAPGLYLAQHNRRWEQGYY